MHDPPIPSKQSFHGGNGYVIFAYDSTRAIHLAGAEQRVHDVAQRPTIAHKRRTLSCFEYQPPLIRFNQDAKPLAIGKFSTRPRFDLIADDFARLNRSVKSRFHIDDEDASILRTLQTLANSYEKNLGSGRPTDV